MTWTPQQRGDGATYNAEYRRNRTAALKRDKWRCQLKMEGCAKAASQVDHLRPVSQGGTHQLSNLQSVCKPCHLKKTAGEGGGYRGRPQRPDPVARPTTNW